MVLVQVKINEKRCFMDRDIFTLRKRFSLDIQGFIYDCSLKIWNLQLAFFRKTKPEQAKFGV